MRRYSETGVFAQIHHSENTIEKSQLEFGSF